MGAVQAAGSIDATPTLLSSDSLWISGGFAVRLMCGVAGGQPGLRWRGATVAYDRVAPYLQILIAFASTLIVHGTTSTMADDGWFIAIVGLHLSCKYLFRYLEVCWQNKKTSPPSLCPPDIARLVFFLLSWVFA